MFPFKVNRGPAAFQLLAAICQASVQLLGQARRQVSAHCVFKFFSMQFCTYTKSQTSGIGVWTQKCWQMEEGVGLLSHRITEYAQLEETHKDH